jgi:hypothetical protein
MQKYFGSFESLAPVSITDVELNTRRLAKIYLRETIKENQFTQCSCWREVLSVRVRSHPVPARSTRWRTPGSPSRLQPGPRYRKTVNMTIIVFTVSQWGIFTR